MGESRAEQRREMRGWGGKEMMRAGKVRGREAGEGKGGWG